MRRGRPVGLGKRVETWSLWLGLAIFGVVAVLGVLSTVRLVASARWVAHTHEVIESLDALTVALSEATNARRGFSLTGNTDELERHARAARTVRDAESRVRSLTADNSIQQHRLDVLEPLLVGRLARLDAAIEARRTRGLEPDREAREIGEGSTAYAEIRSLISALTAEERSLLVERDWSTANSVERIEILQAFGACVSLSLVLAVVVRLRREVGRREQSESIVRDREQAIKRLNEGLEERVMERTAELEMANRELQSFSYAVVHDLRAPLRGMGGFAEVLLDECADTLSADAQDSLREITKNAQHMASLIDALVSMSKIARTELHRRGVDLSGLARAVGERLAAVHPLPHRVLHVQEDLGADADPQLSRTLLEILLENAWKFSANAESPRIDVGASEMNGERVFFVRDTGAGFDMAHADKLFTPFGRLHTVGEFPGIGIGLATAQRIVRRHGGHIWSDGRVDHGANFYFTLRGASGGTRG